MDFAFSLHNTWWGVWKAIIVGWDFSRFVGFNVRDGRSVRIWHDVLCVDSHPLSLFLELFQLAANKDAVVSNYMDEINGGGYIQIQSYEVR